MSFVDLENGIGDATVQSDALVTPDNPKGFAEAIEGLRCSEQFVPIVCPNWPGFYYMSGALNEFFGASINVVHGEIADVGRGCPDAAPPAGVPGGDAYLDSPAGKIALIQRGACYFGSKALRAQQAGAIAVIVWNHVGDQLVEGSSPSEAFAIPSEVTIPYIFVGMSTGTALADAASPVDVKIQGASIKTLRDAVQVLIDNGTLTKNQASGLKNPLKKATSAVRGGHLEKAAGFIGDFRNEVFLLWDFDNGPLPFDDAVALDTGADRLTRKLETIDPPVDM
jgi:hypothetical protein